MINDQLKRSGNCLFDFPSVCAENLNPDVMVMKPAKDRV